MQVKEVALNRKARFDYFIEETLEAGISLSGAEVKSAKLGHMSIADSFCFIEGHSIILKNSQITPYEKGSYYNAEAKRDRVLLMHKREIARFIGKVREKGYTLVPLRAYFKGRYLKVELGLCKGKHTYDKKNVIKERDLNREAERAIRDYKFK